MTNSSGNHYPDNVACMKCQWGFEEWDDEPLIYTSHAERHADYDDRMASIDRDLDPHRWLNYPAKSSLGLSKQFFRAGIRPKGRSA